MRALRTSLLLLSTFLPSSLRLLLWRSLGFAVGKNCRVSPFTVVVAGHIDIGPGSVIDPLTFIYAPRVLRMGERSRIAAFVRILGFGRACLGPQTVVGMGCLINVDSSTAFELGARSGVGPRGTYFTHGGSGLTYTMHFRQRHGDIRIGEDCWLGMACTVYPNVTVGEGTIVFPGVTVTSNLPGGKAIVPTGNLHKVMPLGVATLGVDERFCLAAMEDLLRKWAQTLPRATLVEDRDDLWELRIAGRGRVILLRQPVERPVDAARKEPTVLWRLERDETDHGVPTFEFGELLVSGGWTPFAEKIADELSKTAVIQFAFEDRADRPAAPEA